MGRPGCRGGAQVFTSTGYLCCHGCLLRGIAILPRSAPAEEGIFKRPKACSSSAALWNLIARATTRIHFLASASAICAFSAGTSCQDSLLPNVSLKNYGPFHHPSLRITDLLICCIVRLSSFGLQSFDFKLQLLGRGLCLEGALLRSLPSCPRDCVRLRNYMTMSAHEPPQQSKFRASSSTSLPCNSGTCTTKQAARFQLWVVARLRSLRL